LSQNPVGFGKGFRKSGLKPAFSNKSKVAFPKTEVLGKPPWLQKSKVAFPKTEVLGKPHMLFLRGS
ncbi:MAG: hypothetical protein LBP71_02335, partial [Spirochaetaceae bacterium]|nr:hypothetical protein [Spirochaetaceae bacterium]